MSGTERDDAEGLAATLHWAFHRGWGGPSTPLDLYADSEIWRGQATAVLASDWLAQDDAAVAAKALREFGEDCGRSIEAMATASQYGPHRRAGMRDAAARVRQRANEFADDIESEGRR